MLVFAQTVTYVLLNHLNIDAGAFFLPEAGHAFLFVATLHCFMLKFWQLAMPFAPWQKDKLRTGICYINIILCIKCTYFTAFCTNMDNIAIKYWHTLPYREKFLRTINFAVFTDFTAAVLVLLWKLIPQNLIVVYIHAMII